MNCNDSREGWDTVMRFGIVGTNWITERFIQAAMETDEFSLTAVYSRTEDKGKALLTNITASRRFLQTWRKWPQVIRSMPYILPAPIPYMRSRRSYV